MSETKQIDPMAVIELTERLVKAEALIDRMAHALLPFSKLHERNIVVTTRHRDDAFYAHADAIHNQRLRPLMPPLRADPEGPKCKTCGGRDKPGDWKNAEPRPCPTCGRKCAKVEPHA